RANKLYADGHHARAITFLQQAAKQVLDNIKLQHKLGCWLGDHGLTAEGIARFEKVLEINPDYAPSLVALAQSHSKKHAYDKAMPFVEKALALKPEYATAHLTYGTILQQQGKLSEAVEHFRTALQLRLNSPPKPVKQAKKQEDFGDPEIEALVWDTLATLAKAGVHAFASYGTLLGF